MHEQGLDLLAQKHRDALAGADPGAGEDHRELGDEPFDLAVAVGARRALLAGHDQRGTPRLHLRPMADTGLSDVEIGDIRPEKPGAQVVPGHGRLDSRGCGISAINLKGDKRGRIEAQLVQRRKRDLRAAAGGAVLGNERHRQAPP